MSTTSSHSNKPSNCSNCSSNFRYFSINATKLKGHLQQSFESLGQFVLTNINFARLAMCKWHLKFVNMSIKKKILLFQFEIL